MATTFLPELKLPLSQQLAGVIIGTAVGDALGLPAEGLSRRRIQKRWKGLWRHRFLFGRGMCSDDTEHTFLVAQALLTCGDDLAAFRRSLAWKLRFWLLGLPAGVGFATLRSIIKLWLGFPPDRSGVFSAGNGPAMRTAILGAYFADDLEKRRSFVSASTRITHSDPKAETAALAVAEAAPWAINQDKGVDELLTGLQELGRDEGWQTLSQRLMDFYTEKKSVQDFADALGQSKGVSGYAYHSVPVALYAFFRHSGDFHSAVVAALDCGGDTDTVGAIVGALCGARQGVDNIPDQWHKGICEWPRSSAILSESAKRLAQQKQSPHPLGPVRYFWPALILRNTIFTLTVLVHGLARLLP